MPQIDLSDEHTKFKLLMCGNCHVVIAWPDEWPLAKGHTDRSFKKLCIRCERTEEFIPDHMIHIGKGQIRG